LSEVDVRVVEGDRKDVHLFHREVNVPDAADAGALKITVETNTVGLELATS
jgi:hypothetical protein